MSADPMPIKALAPWFGGKRTLAPRIVAELGKHNFYVEPFCGSLAIIMAKAPGGMETVNDLHADLINLARVVASEAATDLFAKASRMLMHEGIHAEFKAALAAAECEPAPSVSAVEQRHVDRALAYLVMSWQGRNGSAGTSPSNVTVARRFTSNGGAGGLRWSSAVASIPAWHDRLRNVSITRMDAFELIDRLEDAAGTVLYADPPYLRKSDKYIHDLAPGDHRRLAESLKRFKRTRVVLSYYDEPELREWYAGWTWVSCPVTKGLVNQGRRDVGGIVAAPEVLIINGDSYTSGGSLFSGPSLTTEVS